MATLPEIQQEMRGLALVLRWPSLSASITMEDLAVQLEKWADGISRRPMKRRAPAISDRMSLRKYLQIKEVRAREPDWTLQQIAEECNVNIGRVSETLSGKRR